MTTYEEDPLFKTPTGALLFALNYSHGGMKEPSITALIKERDDDRPKGKGLSGLDGAAQAGMIQLELRRMSELRRALIVARYAISSARCECGRACCRGYRENPDWAEAINWLTFHVLVQGLTGTISHYRFRRALVCRHFGVKETFTIIAAQCGISRDNASEQYKRVHEYLKKEERAARFEIAGLLEGTGVVE